MSHLLDPKDEVEKRDIFVVSQNNNNRYIFVRSKACAIGDFLERKCGIVIGVLCVCVCVRAGLEERLEMEGTSYSNSPLLDDGFCVDVL